MTSPDGINWTARTSAANNVWRSVCWSPELMLFVAVASTSIDTSVMTSANGITWTARTPAANNAWRSVCWSPELGLFVAVAETGTSNRVMTSPDGINWTARTSAANNSWRSVCWSPELGIFVVVSESGTGNLVMTNTFKEEFLSSTGGTITGNLGIGVINPTNQLELSTDSAAKQSTSTWTVSSDERLKTDIALADSNMCWEAVKNIPLKRYTWREDVYTTKQVGDRSKLGWIAQDVQAVFPKAVRESEAYGFSNCLSLDTDQLYAVMYGALQKALAEIEVLEGARPPVGVTP